MYSSLSHIHSLLGQNIFTQINVQKGFIFIQCVLRTLYLLFGTTITVFVLFNILQ